MARVEEIKMGRNFIRVGDLVKVKPSRPGKRDGFVGRVEQLHTDDDTGELTECHAVGPTGFRVVRAERVQRVSQTVHGEQRRR